MQRDICRPLAVAARNVSNVTRSSSTAEKEGRGRRERRHRIGLSIALVVWRRRRISGIFLSRKFGQRKQRLRFYSAEQRYCDWETAAAISGNKMDSKPFGTENLHSRVSADVLRMVYADVGLNLRAGLIL